MGYREVQRQKILQVEFYFFMQSDANKIFSNECFPLEIFEDEIGDLLELNPV